MAKSAEATAAETFADLVRREVADSVIVYDSSGRVTYPESSELQTDDEPTESMEWLQARQREFQEKDHTAAADAYARITAQTSDPNIAARALQAQARCLVKAGQNQAAVEILTGELADPKYHDAKDSQGGLIVPSGQLRALQLMADPLAGAYRGTLALVVERLNDYGDSSLRASQRRFLMEELRQSVPECPEFPTLAAEILAADYLDSKRDERSPAAAALRPTGLRDVWQLASPDKPVLALFREERILSDMQALIDAELSVPDVSVQLVPPGTEWSQEQAPFLTAPAGDYLPNWTLSLRFTGSDPFTAAAETRVAIYLWSGIVVVVAIAILAGLVARYVGVQMRLTRLKNDLIATVTHELKTPLASTRALADMLLEGRYQDEKQRQEYLELIAKENQRLSRLIDNFLAFSRMERNKRTFEVEEVKIDALVSAALDAERERFEPPGCRLDVDIAAGLPNITGDTEALTTVLINLLDNAYKYTGNDKHIVLRAYADDGAVCLEVEDNGVGLSRRAAKKVFDRFYQVDPRLSRSSGGCGLGLSIVQFIVTAHGGSVTVASQPDRGSTFRVMLPATNN